VLAWAIDRGASVYCHWFQPLGASGVRHGQRYVAMDFRLS